MRDEATRVVFSVPSGNLGNLTAGVIAQRLGLPVSRFVAASNVNDVLPEFLRTGVYRARPSIATLSNAMDVGDPSNFDRLLALHDRSTEVLRANVEGAVVSEEETRTTIREVYRRTGYVLDPHASVGYAAARHTDPPVIVLATAHPAKFGDAIREELGFEPTLPDAYRDWASQPILSQTMPDTSYESFKAWLERTL